MLNTSRKLISLLRALSPGVPVDVHKGGDLHAELLYENHPSSGLHSSPIHEKIVSDVIDGRAIVFKRQFAHDIIGFRVSPLGVVEQPKLRIIHDLTFDGSGSRTSVNIDTDFDCAPSCELGHVLRDVLTRVLYLRQNKTSAH